MNTSRRVSNFTSFCDSHVLGQQGFCGYRPPSPNGIPQNKPYPPPAFERQDSSDSPVLSFSRHVSLSTYCGPDMGAGCSCPCDRAPAHGRGDRRGLGYLPPGMRNIRAGGRGCGAPGRRHHPCPSEPAHVSPCRVGGRRSRADGDAHVREQWLKSSCHSLQGNATAR